MDGTKSANGVLLIDWCTDLFPQQLVDILYENQTCNVEERGTEDDFEDDDFRKSNLRRKILQVLRQVQVTKENKLMVVGYMYNAFIGLGTLYIYDYLFVGNAVETFCTGICT